MDKIKNLLQQVSIIQKKYDDLAEYSGEHYNVFDILGVRSDELSHSAILTNLLDAKGRHGQKDIFLELFIKQIKPLLEKSRYSEHINSFVTKEATAKKEIHIGGVKHETAEGGRVDIVVSSGNKHLVIENKIYAGDQDQQLLRYDNHYKNDPIIYLTRLGSEPSPASKGDLVLGIDFICISYHTDISNWLEQCIKEMVNKPIIRETLNQYLFLIKSLTNQSNNNKMSDEIVNIMAKNLDSSFEIYKNFTTLKTNLFISFIEKIKNKFSNEIIIDFSPQGIGKMHSNVTFKKNNWDNIKVMLYFNGNDFSSVIIGVHEGIFNPNYKEPFTIAFKNISFGKTLTYSNWYKLYSYERFSNINSSEFWKNINSESFINSVFEDLEILFETIDKTLEMK
jgi:hypothetical protein